MDIGFLVQLADGCGRDLAAPQGLGDVLHTGTETPARYISMSASSTLLRTNSLIWPLITSSFSCTIFSDIVCCLLSNVCVVTSFYQSLQAMSSFMRFSICATYCTLSYESGRIAWIYGETKLSGKINIQRSCFSSYYYSSTAQPCGKLHGAFCTYRIFMRNTDK